MPYTYLLGWRSKDLWYYGVRWANGCTPSELWVKYFTSSDYVKRIRDELGEPDVVEVRRVFTDPQKARSWEEWVIRRMKAVRSDRWLNRGNGGKEFAGPSPEYLKKWADKLRGVKRPPSVGAKISAARKGKATGCRLSAEAIERMRQMKIGVPRSDETKEKLRIANVGKVISEETRRKISASSTGAKRSEDTKRKMREAWELRKARKLLTGA